MVIREQLSKTYSDKNIFLTGHTGFKGSWMLKILELLEANVTGYALAPENDNDLFHLIRGEELCSSIISDLRERQALTEALLEAQPDYVFHFAAQPLVRRSYDSPSETFEVNAVGTANVLDAVRQLDKPCAVVLITTDKVYDNKEWHYPYRETDRLGGYDPYSASKACAELVIDAYRSSFFNLKEYSQHQKGIAVARAGNVIGGGDWSENRLIPDLAKAFGNKETLTIRNPKSLRPWQHVLEPLVGYLMLGRELSGKPISFGAPFNFGPQLTDAISVKQMVEIAIKEWGSGNYEVKENTSQPHEAGLLKLDISKTINLLGWKPQMDAHEAVSWTLNWYKKYFEGADMAKYTKTQITAFLD